MRDETVFASAARTASANSDDFDLPYDAAGVLLFLNVSAASGTTPTLDVKLQTKDPISGSYLDIPGAAFTQKTTAAGLSTLTVHPFATASPGVIAQALGRTLRVATTVAGTTPSFTYSVAVNYIG